MQQIDKIKAYFAKQPVGEGGVLLEILYFAFRTGQTATNKQPPLV